MPEATDADRLAYGDDWTLSIHLDFDAFATRFVDGVGSLVEEVRLEIEPECIRTTAVEPARVAMAETTLAREDSGDRSTVVGVNVSWLADALTAVDPDPETLKLTIDSDHNPTVTLTTRFGTETIDALDPDDVRTVDYSDGYERTSTAEVDAWRLAGGLTGITTAATSSVRLSATDGTLLLEGNHPIDGWPARWPLQADVDGDGHGRYSADYLATVADAVTGKGHAVVVLGRDVPVEIVTDNVTYRIAPVVIDQADSPEVTTDVC